MTPDMRLFQRLRSAAARLLLLALFGHLALLAEHGRQMTFGVAAWCAAPSSSLQAVAAAPWQAGADDASLPWPADLQASHERNCPLCGKALMVTSAPLVLPLPDARHEPHVEQPVSVSHGRPIWRRLARAPPRSA